MELAKQKKRVRNTLRQNEPEGEPVMKILQKEN